jgi:OOP family OmpA-OmpF porin
MDKIKPLVLSTILATSVFSWAKDNTLKFPLPENENGFVNVNSKKEYTYDIYPSKVFWSEHGRAYWRAVGRSKEVTKNQIETDEKDEIKTTQSSISRADSDSDGVLDQNDRCPNGPVGAPVNAWGCALEKKNNQYTKVAVQFELNRAQLASDKNTDLDALARSLQANPDLKVQIQGHTDTTGDREFNLSLSKQRARSVVKYLVDKHAINADRLEAKGMGPDEPVASNDLRSGRILNRRVEAHIIQ